ncbi:MULTISPECIES: alpha-amylase family protein [unclassified Actinobaculum]|uniref:alpha-amylase family protein n=1 Tax=unclassified Actinobaculum TaxID=2609299 RepID=UPI000D52873F|nr:MULTISPECIES: alpha-amylase family protein [unclassified Actinobaculum]AWE43048.1 alpha-amylase [Actinobaculum sp. 313]RTE48567.1 alpha-amylase [Actinobaculum sp. 352]
MPLDAAGRQSFELRWERYSPQIRAALTHLYPGREREVEERLCALLLAAFKARSPELRRLDEERLLRPDWLQLPEMIGYVCYADRFAGNLAGIADRVDYLTDLGVRYLHVMPFLRPREGANDGGYAVQDYRSVRPDLGTMDDLEELATVLREHRISLEMDLVLNHVAKEHEWAQCARAGEQKYRDYFLMFPDRKVPDEYEKTLPEIFPDFAPGNFTWNDDAAAWVWTTFNDYQWDLNWANPDVLCEFVDLICWLANKGVEVFRLDAIAFTWKRLGTTSQNQPEVHDLTQAMRACLRIAAPAVAFKAEAIVAPEDLMAYLGRGEHYGLVSDMAYHNELMVQLWNCVATGEADMAQAALAAMPSKPPSATWATYVRCHDDIGWAISDADAAAVGVSGFDHRAFLSDFYSGEFPDSFARGLVFQANQATGDRRISGSCASLAGLEIALERNDGKGIDAAIARIILMHAVMFGYGGVPLLYMGDEIGLLNDMDYARDPAHAEDNRWAHRPFMDWDMVDKLPNEPLHPARRINEGIRHLIDVRVKTPQLHASIPSEVVESPDSRLLIFERLHPLGTLVEVYNFSNQTVRLHHGVLTYRLGYDAQELIGNNSYDLRPATIDIAPYQPAWFIRADRS